MYKIHIKTSRGCPYGFTGVQNIVAWLDYDLPLDKSNNRVLECWAGEQVSSEVGAYLYW